MSQRRTWRKLHLGVDEATGEIIAAVVTTNDVHDGQVLGDLLEHQAVELLLQCAALNRMIQIAKPDSVWVDA